MTKEQLDQVTSVAIVRAECAVNDVLTEMDSRYRDGDSHALIAEIRQRTTESLRMMRPALKPVDVPHSGK